MQTAKYFIGVIGVVLITFLAACYDNNGNDTTSGVPGAPSTNNLAPGSITNATFTLQYSSGPLANTTETLQVFPDNTFIRRPVLTIFGTESSGTYSTPLLTGGGNIWSTTLHTTVTNNVSANFSEILALTFNSASTGSFLLNGATNSNSGTFTAISGLGATARLNSAFLAASIPRFGRN